MMSAAQIASPRIRDLPGLRSASELTVAHCSGRRETTLFAAIDGQKLSEGQVCSRRRTPDIAAGFCCSHVNDSDDLVIVLEILLIPLENQRKRIHRSEP